MNKKIVIKGEKVHYVGYRPFLLARALELDIPNYFTRNVKKNGLETVEVSIGGNEEQINEFINFVKNNHPPEAKVSDIKEVKAPGRIMSIEKYDRVLASEQQNTMVQAGLGMLNMQEQTLEKQDQTVDIIRQGNEKMLEKQDQTIDIIRQGNEKMLEKQDQTVDNQKKMLEKQDQTVKSINKLDRNMNQKFDSLDDKYGEISKNLVRAVEGIERLLERSERDRQDFRDAIMELADAIRNRR